MTINASGPVSLVGCCSGVSIRKELGLSGALGLTCTSVRTLAGVASGAITMPGNFYGKSSSGSISYTTPGCYSWLAPSGVTSVSVVAVGGGGGGTYCFGGAGGGALAWYNNISVTPGSYYTIKVGAGQAGFHGQNQTRAQSSSAPGLIALSSFEAQGGMSKCGGFGKGSQAYYTGQGGGNGGFTSQGGGGAGGYSGQGGAKYVEYPYCGTYPSAGGAGGGGGRLSAGAVSRSTTPRSGGGGGVGILGLGSTGSFGGDGTSGSAYVPFCPYYGAPAVPAIPDIPPGGGGGGSGGQTGYATCPAVSGYKPGGHGGNYGGGGGFGWNFCGGGGSGGQGAVRIVWPGSSRTFPSTNVGTP
jgi:hypothetical protein